MFRYDDFVDGDRLKRVYAAMRPGSSALTGVLFFDAINRDKKGESFFGFMVNDCFEVCLEVSFELCIDV